MVKNMNDIEIKQSKNYVLSWIKFWFDIEQKLLNFFNRKITFITIWNRTYNEFRDVSGFDYKLALFGKKRCECCNGFGFVDGQ